MPDEHEQTDHRPPMLPTAEMGSVTAWIAGMGDEEAVAKLVQRYFAKLVRVGRGKYQRTFGDVPRPAEDEEDAANSALKSFWRQATTKGFPDLVNRYDLWQILVMLAIRKVFKQRARAMAKKRGGGVPPVSCSPAELENVVDKLSDQQAALEFEELCSAALRILEPELRRIAELLYFQNRAIRQIANELGVTERTVRRKLERIREIWDKEFADANS